MASPFITADDLAALLRRTLNAASAEEAVQAVSDEIRGHTKQTITQATTEDREFRPLPSGKVVVLAELPVDTVTVTIDGEAFEDFEVDPDTGILCRTDGHLWPNKVVVTYTHGYPDEDDRLRTARRVCLYAAARIYVNPEQTMQKRRGDYSASYGSSTVEASGLTAWERRLLSRTYPSPDHRF